MPLAAFLAVAWLFSGLCRAQPSPTRVGVLELALADVDVLTARELCQRVRSQLAQHAEYSVGDTRVTLEQLSLAEGCDASQNACLSKIARQLGVDALVFGTVSHQNGVVMVRLSRYDVTGEAIARSAFASLPQHDALPADIERKAAELTNDLFEFSAAHTTSLLPTTAATHVRATEARVLADPTSGDSGRLLTGYALLGGAVLSAGLSVASFVGNERVQRNDVLDQYRRAVGQLSPWTNDVCDEAAVGKRYGLDAASFKQVKSSCSAGKTFEVLQFVFLGGAVLSGGLSAYLLFSGEKQAEHPLIGNERFSLHPTLQRRGAAINARFRF